MSAGIATESTSRGRLTAFRVIAGIGGALATVSNVIFAIPSFVDEDKKIHVVHNIAGLSSFVLLMGVPLLYSHGDLGRWRSSGSCWPAWSHRSSAA
jgi:hypothetical protein